MAVEDPEEGPGGPGPRIFRPNWGLKGRKKFFCRPPPPPYLRVWMTSPLLISRSGSCTVLFFPLSFRIGKRAWTWPMKTSLMKFSILLSRLRFFNFFQFVTKMPNIFHVWQDTLSDIDVLIGPIVTVLFVFYRVTGIEWTVLRVDTQQ